MSTPTAPLTAEDLARLKEIAEKATPGPWQWNDCNELYAAESPPYSEPLIQTDSGVYGPRENDAAFIAAFNPQNALSLISQVETLTAERDEAREDAERNKRIWRRFREDQLPLAVKSEKLRAGLEIAEAAMSIVEPRSDKAKYLEALAEVRAALAAGDPG